MQEMTFKQYYDYYLTLHSNPVNRMLHVVGNILTLVYVFSCIYFSNFFLLIFAPAIIYPFAWSGHLFFEKNKPAAWSKPIWAKVCDWVMIWNMIKSIFRNKK